MEIEGQSIFIYSLDLFIDISRIFVSVEPRFTAKEMYFEFKSIFSISIIVLESLNK